MNKKMKIAVLGLGRMGGQIARRLHKNDFEVLAWNRSLEPVAEIQKKGIWATSDLSELMNAMPPRKRIFWLMLPHSLVDDFLFSDNYLKSFLKRGDIVIDGGNSFFKDTVRRSKILAKKGIYYFDSGTSGGIWGEQNGFALMVGGPAPIFPVVRPIFKALSGGDNFAYLGKSGAGHFAKMVHNGIEYGMMEAIGEGYAVLQKSKYDFNLADVTKVYQKGTVIRSWLIDLCADIFKKENIEGTLGQIGATGEGEWTIKTAKELRVPISVIEQSFKVRKESRKSKNWSSYSNKIVALLRKQFGGHKINLK